MSTTPGPSIGRGRPADVDGVGTLASVAGLTHTVHGGNGIVQTLKLTLTAMSLTITDALAYASQLLYTMPAGRIVILGSVASLTFTTTSAIAGTLNTGVTVQWSVGHAAASATTLATTMLTWLPGTGGSVPTFTSSTTINVAPATATGAFTLTTLQSVDGTTTPAPVYLNVAVGTGTDIDADATLSITGTISITFANLGDY